MTKFKIKLNDLKILLQMLIQKHCNKMQNQENTKNPVQTQKIKISSAISLLQRKHYGCLSKIFCCKCFYCCQDVDFSLLTSKHRKGAFQRMVKKYLKSMHTSALSKTNVIMDPFFILVALLLGQQSEIYHELLQEFSNSNQNTIFSKEDLEFYIPQLCTYLVFHEQMSNAQLSTLLQRACKIDLHFSLRYYFFMKSLQTIDSTYQIKKLPIVEKYNIVFRNKINHCHKAKITKKQIKKQKQNDLRVTWNQQIKQNQYTNKKSAQYIDKKSTQYIDKKSTQYIDKKSTQYIDKKQTKDQTKRLSLSDSNKFQRSNSLTISRSSSQLSEEADQINQQKLINCRKYNSQGQKFEKITNLVLYEVYEHFISKKQQNYPKGLFQSTADFFNDLVALSQLLMKNDLNRNQIFTQSLHQMNSKLPACVYIPFTKPEYQDLVIVNIIIKQSRIFRTKQRAPYKICFQTICNAHKSEQSNREKKIRSTSNRTNVRRSVLFQQDIMLEIPQQINQTVQKLSSQTLQQKHNQKYINSSKQQRNSMSFAQNMRHSLSPQKQKDQNLHNSGSGLSDGSKIDFKNIKKNFWDKVFKLKNRAKQLIINDLDNKQIKTQKSINLQKSVILQKGVVLQKSIVLQKNIRVQNNPNIQKGIHFQRSKKMQKIHSFQPYPSQIQDDITTQTMSQLQKPQKKLTNPKSQPYQQSIIQIQSNLFGQSFQDNSCRISQMSIYSRLNGYKLINMMVKSNDDLRQECFAMQLLQQFQRIFKMEKLKLILSPYQVLPLSHNSGIIQFIPQAITIDQLIKKSGNLAFVQKSKDKMKNFIRSLAAYSLVTYFLQVKDRHNANIMIKRDGTLLHIDYGFFLSSMPGKGVQLQKNIPFKLTSQYIFALGGQSSKSFSQFRLLFYQGFNALRKHQHRILILAKLMYSSYGTSMKCFQKGDQSIEKLVERFNPKVRTDGELSLFCQQLINLSVQNWRAKWYDRYQYFAQGILY